ncbi:hypothetical protein ACU686_12050 [Yinghuangia aomiensis]
MGTDSRPWYVPDYGPQPYAGPSYAATPTRRSVRTPAIVAVVFAVAAPVLFGATYVIAILGFLSSDGSGEIPAAYDAAVKVTLTMSALCLVAAVAATVVVIVQAVRNHFTERDHRR